MKVENVKGPIIEVISNQILGLRSIEQGRPAADCRQSPEIVAAKAEMKEILSSFLTLKVGGTEKEDALKAAHLLFDSYCEQIEVTEVMMEDPEDWVSDGLYETEEEVIADGEELAEFCQQLMVVARQLWSVSYVGLDNVF